MVYSLHSYDPYEFCMQGIDDVKGLTYEQAQGKIGIKYPGMIAGVNWDRRQLERFYQPVIAFQSKYQAPIFVGEFSAVQWAPGDAAWLRDAIGLYESHGWSWSFHELQPDSVWWSPLYEGSFWMNHGMEGHPRPSAPSQPAERFMLLKAAWAKNG